MEGWISLHRKICDNWVWKDKPFSYGQAWMDILLECNHEENKVLIKKKLLIVQRGESVNSLKTWANRWGWSISATRHFLDLLKNDKMCDMVNERVTTRLKVCNYNSYQDKQHAEGTQKARRRIAEESQKDTDNKENKENNDNNINTTQNLWIRTFGRNPKLPEVEVTEQIIKKFGYDKTYKIMKKAVQSNFQSIFTLMKALDKDGNIKEKEDEKSGKSVGASKSELAELYTDEYKREQAESD